MKSPTSKWLAKLAQLSPGAVLTGGSIYTLTLGLLDYKTPLSMSFTLFYVLGTMFVGWGAGPRAALLHALLSAAVVMSHDWTVPDIRIQPVWIGVWNVSSRCMVLCAAGWLTAELR